MGGPAREPLDLAPAHGGWEHFACNACEPAEGADLPGIFLRNVGNTFFDNASLIYIRVQ